MDYNILKILHILSASLFLASLGYSYILWKKLRVEGADTLPQILKQTGLVMLPLTLIQLTSGFTLISLKHYDYSQSWISGSFTSFILVILSWFSFIYCLVASQQVGIAQNSKLSLIFERAEKYSLYVCKFSLLAAIFFMSTRIGSPL